MEKKKEIREIVKENNLPDNFAKITDTEILNKILSVVKANI